MLLLECLLQQVVEYCLLRWKVIVTVVALVDVLTFMIGDAVFYVAAVVRTADVEG